ncbi:prolyl oligopeptidase [Diplocarpon rosae]|nr:prolyl oligopeptidase [Diplocarpon rosae]
MTVRAEKFTPEVLLSAPRRSAATPNADGTLALFTVQTWSFQSHSKSVEIRVLDVKTGQTKVLTEDKKNSEPTWLGEKNLVLWLRAGEKGTTGLVLGDAENLEKKPEEIATFNGAVENLKVTHLDSDTIALVVTGLATPSGELYNADNAEKPLTTGRIYNKLFVRHWDAYVTENTNAIWYTTLKKPQGACSMVVAPLRNALAGHSFSLESPVPPFGGKGDFDISKNGIVFVAKDPKLNDATTTKTNLYYIPLRTFSEARAPSPQLVKTGNLKGYSGSPVFSPNAKSVAFTRMKSQQYESDKPRLLLLPDITDLSNVQEFYETSDGEGRWDLKPEGITWSEDGEELYVTAEENGRGKLFKIPASPHRARDLPFAITHDGAVSSVELLPNNQLFVNSSSLVDNSIWSILNPAKPSEKSIISSSFKGGKSFGISQAQVDEFWYVGAEDQHIHAWLIKPSNFDPKKKYPLAYLIHGGPQGAWNESWSTRWNPLIYAEQGYVVVTPNPTGSSGYGMALQNGIKNNWGGRPYIDLEKGFEYIEANLSYVDTTRAVALGASYGGYMINWIQGHPLGRKFRALVTHDGVFCTLNQYASEELFFPLHDFGGSLWENREVYEKWDPSKFTGEWATPHLIIHNELDYRLPIGEGLAPFNVLQSRGVQSKFLTFSDENHWVLKPENSLLWHKTVLDWINHYSGITEQHNKELSVRIKRDEVGTGS